MLNNKITKELLQSYIDYKLSHFDWRKFRELEVVRKQLKLSSLCLPAELQTRYKRNMYPFDGSYTKEQEIKLV